MKSNIFVLTKGWENIDRTALTKKAVPKFISKDSLECVKDCPRFMSVKYIAEMFDIHHCTVLEWIRNGLQAHDVGSGKRPTYRIFRDHLAQYLANKVC